jgi:stage II sporulation protein D
MRRIALVLTLCGGLVLLPGTARGGTTFTFYGSGWGHGIGLSQWGAQGLATKGWGPGKIVKHYYRGTTVAQKTPPADRFRIGILQYRDEVTLHAERGDFRLELSSGRVLSRVREGGTRRVLIRRAPDGKDIYKIRNGAGQLVASGGSSSNHLKAIRGSGAVIRVVDSRWPHMVGRGFLEFNIDAPRDSAHVLAIVTAETYLFGLAEVPSSWDMDALEAQAIAARSYAWEKIARLGQWRSGCNCGLFATTADQFYVGWDKEVAAMGDRWVAAVRGSSRRVALYGGSIIQAYYSAASGGHTENKEIVWGGPAIAYLKGVCDPAEYDVTWPNDSLKILERWSASFGENGLAGRLRGYTGQIGDRITAFSAWSRGVSGRVREARVHGTQGRSAVVTGWEMRSALRLRDTRFWLNSNRSVTGKIRQSYDNLSCRPGIAASPQRDVAGGRFQKFDADRDRLYHHAGRDVVTWLRGPILTRYLAEGGHGGPLGLPYRWRTTDGGNRLRAWFDGGGIVCTRPNAVTPWSCTVS